ncbi:MAG TPA: hypothetical protein VF132_07990, partial [Rudaea sp.]
EGGWNSDCTAHTQNASLTVLDGSSTNPVLAMHRINGYETVRWLTIQNGKSSGSGAGLTLSPTNPFVESNGTQIISDTIIRDNVSGGMGGGIFILNYAPSTFIYLENNLIVGNHADGSFGAAKIDSGGVPVSLINNTVAHNTTGSAGGVGGIYVHTDNSNSGSNTLTILDNIFWDNGLYSLDIDSTGAFLDYNDIDASTGSAPFETVGGMSVNPLFVDGTSDFHLQSGSPLFHVSPSGDRTAVDPEGHGYPQNGNADIGAYSDTLFTDGFDTFHGT